jgi:putative transposase
VTEAAANVRELAALSETVRKLALDRFRLLQPHLEQRIPLPLVAREAGIAYRTAQRWVMRYQKYGLAALVRQNRNDRGQRRTLSSSMQEFIEGLALEKPQLPIAGLCRRVQLFAQEHGESAPTYDVVYDIVRQLPADLLTMAHHGEKAYSETFELIHRREANRPNAMWQADHSLLDILLLRNEGQPQKPWLTLILDDYSRAVAGYFLSFEAPSAIQTAVALRQAIWRKDDPRWNICGVPEVLYTDNGSDFSSHHLEQVSADLKMQLVFSIPGRPRGRGRIERLFSTITQMLLCELPGYTSPKIGMRGKPTLKLSQLDGLFREFLLEVYHRREHSETKTSPAERWEKGGFLPRMPESLQQLDLLLLTVPRARKVHADGIRFQGLRYVDTVLAAYVGESVTLRYDPRDLAEVRVFHQERFVCRAICPELPGATIPLREILRARNQRRRELRTIVRDRKKTVDTLLEIKGANEIREESGETNRASKQGATKPALKRYRNE